MRMTTVPPWSVTTWPSSTCYLKSLGPWVRETSPCFCCCYRSWVMLSPSPFWPAVQLLRVRVPWSTELWFTASRVSNPGLTPSGPGLLPSPGLSYPSFSNRLWPQYLVPLVTTDILGLSCPLKTTAWTLPMASLNLPLSFSILFCSLLRQNTVIFMQLSTTLTLKEYVGPGNRTLVGDRHTSSKMTWHLAINHVFWLRADLGVRCSQWWQ